MTEIFLTIFFISILLFFLGTGIWVAISMIGVSAIGMIIFTSRPVGDAMATTIWGTSSSWTLTALPFFPLSTQNYHLARLSFSQSHIEQFLTHDLHNPSSKHLHAPIWMLRTPVFSNPTANCQKQNDQTNVATHS